jgi:hypothetical protein
MAEKFCRPKGVVTTQEMRVVATCKRRQRRHDDTQSIDASSDQSNECYDQTFQRGPKHCVRAAGSRGVIT